MIVQNDYPYEILFRLAKDGSVSGCHRKDLRVLEDDTTGQIYSEQELDPVAITAGELMDGVLGTINTAVLTTIADREATITDLEDQLSACQNSAAAMYQEINGDGDSLLSE